jgi:hypothetical protein
MTLLPLSTPHRSWIGPHIIFNSATKKYVCWLKIKGEGDVQTSTVLTSASFHGPYEIVRS